MSHAEFKDLILPTIQKSLLRSPENVIESRSPPDRMVGGGWVSWYAASLILGSRSGGGGVKYIFPVYLVGTLRGRSGALLRIC